MHLVLFGPCAWWDGERLHPLPGGKATDVAVLLAGRGHDIASNDELLDSLWSEPPTSGLNALQRHVSRLRSQLRDLGADPDRVVRTVAGGYALGPDVTTDLELVKRSAGVLGPVQRPHAGARPPWWWRQPLLGASPDLHVMARSALTLGAGELAVSWATAELADGDPRAVLDHLLPLVDALAHEERIWRLLVDAADRTGDAAVTAAVADAMRSTYRELDVPLPSGWGPGPQTSTARVVAPELLDLEQVRRPAALWMTGEIDQARRAVAGIEPALPPDILRRTDRWLSVMRPTNGFAKSLVEQLVAASTSMPLSAERALLSLDALAIEATDALDVVDAEIEAAETDDELERALRVRYQVGLGHPFDATQRSIVERLTALATATAQVEAARFAALNAAKRGEFIEATSLLERYDAIVRSAFPDEGDDFADLCRTVMRLHPELDLPDLGEGDIALQFPRLTPDRATIDQALAWRLVTSEDPVPTTVGPALAAATSTTWPDTAAAFNLLLRLKTDPAVDVAREARVLLDTVIATPRHRHWHAGVAALARVALQERDTRLARTVADLLRPWSGEQLGMWPLDVLIGPADGFIAALDDLATTSLSSG